MSYLPAMAEATGVPPAPPLPSHGLSDFPSMPGGTFGWAAIGVAAAWLLFSHKAKRKRQREYGAGKAKRQREYEDALRRYEYETEREQLGLRRKR